MSGAATLVELGERYHEEAVAFLARHARRREDEIVQALRIAAKGLALPPVQRRRWSRLLELMSVLALLGGAVPGFALLLAPLDWGWVPLVAALVFFLAGNAASWFLFKASREVEMHERRVPDAGALVLERLATTCLGIGRTRVYLLEERDNVFTLDASEIKGATVDDHGDGTARFAIQAFRGSPAGSLDSIVLDPVALHDAEEACSAILEMRNG